MRRTLQILALALVVATGILWFATGANKGWTKTSVEVITVDEVTCIEGRDYQKRFVPGVDFVGVALVGAGLLAGASLLFRNKPISTIKT